MAVSVAVTASMAMPEATIDAAGEYIKRGGYPQVFSIPFKEFSPLARL